MDMKKTQFSPNFKAGYVLKDSNDDIKKFENKLLGAFQTTVE